TALVSPVTIGDGAYTGTGSVITKDVPPGALGVARGRQVNLEGWATKNKEKRLAAKAAKKDAPSSATKECESLQILVSKLLRTGRIIGRRRCTKLGFSASRYI